MTPPRTTTHSAAPRPKRRAAARALGAALVFALAALVAPAPAQENEQENATVTLAAVVLDIETIFRNSVAMRSLETALRDRQELALDEFGGREEALFAEGRELQSQRGILTPEAFDERAQELDRRGQKLAEEAETYGNQLDRFLRDGLNEVREQAFRFAEEAAAAVNADAVLSKDTLFLLNEELEITAGVLEKINQNLKITQAETELAAFAQP